jgi:hypothetical protein
MPGGPSGFGLDFSQDMGEMTFITRAAKNEEFGAAYNPNMGDAFEGPAGSFFDPFAGSSGMPGGPAAGPSMEFTLDLGSMLDQLCLLCQEIWDLVDLVEQVTTMILQQE